MTKKCVETCCEFARMGKDCLPSYLFHNIPNAKVARFLGFTQGFHGQIVDANTVLDVF